MYPHAHITGWGFYVPPRIVTNDELSQLVPTSDSWIRERTGIAARHIADDTDFTSTMAIKAGRRALEVADMDPGKVELVLVATSTPDYLMPATACMVQDGLGCTKFGAHFLREHPDFLLEPFPSCCQHTRNFCGLDRTIAHRAMELGLQPHVHRPGVSNLNERWT